ADIVREAISPIDTGLYRISAIGDDREQVRKLSAILVSALCVFLASFCHGAARDDASLKSLYDAHRWFELRDAVEKGTAPIFYRGIVACVFDHLDACKKDLDIIFNSAPKSDEAVEGHRTLGSAYRRHGKYRDALAQIDALLAVRPKDSDAAGDRPLLKELGN